MPKCTINGKEVEVKEGTSIIEAMFQSGDRIAHYCYHPGLSVAGVCRLCMVEVEGNPRVQIACNTTVTEGMKINNTSPKVKEAVKWGLDFHLINHPLDCPICDQAGECGLQEQYIEFGQYDSEMAEHKQKKRKVVDLGPSIVLDSERCILCSRCVRFTDEVSKTNELGIFSRGDRSEIGTFEGKKLDNNYSLNTVDICPVGALTSKDFRFRQRVWYLKNAETVCTGCSTGCNIKVYFNKEGFFRVKPVYNEKINGYWMCDEGRGVYKFVNKEHRMTKGMKKADNQWIEMSGGAVAKDAGEFLKKSKAQGIGLVLTGQYSTEEYQSLMDTFVNEYQINRVYHWVNNKESFEDFDQLLMRGDKNPNTKGLLKVLSSHKAQSNWSDLEAGINSGGIKTLVVLGPENQAAYPDLNEKIALLGKVENMIWCQAGKNENLQSMGRNTWLIPMKTFVEKEGSFINYSGIEQKFNRITTVISEALTGQELGVLLSGKPLSIEPVNTFSSNSSVNSVKRPDQVTLENRKKNEFIFKRGSL